MLTAPDVRWFEAFMMTRVLSSILFCVISTTAIAADAVPVEDPQIITADQAVPEAPSKDRWAGAYAGVSIGHGYLQDYATLFGVTAEGDDMTYGAFAGYNFQFGHFVVGAEVSADRANILFTDGSNIRSEFMYDVKLRGGLANDWAMVYATVGVEHGVTNIHALFPAQANASNDSALQLGAGIDIAVTDNIAVGANYTYAKYKEFGGFSFLGSSVDVETQKLQLRLSYRFN
jgi:outer membrane immunogenic protein